MKWVSILMSSLHMMETPPWKIIVPDVCYFGDSKSALQALLSSRIIPQFTNNYKIF